MPRFKESKGKGGSTRYWEALIYPENMVENWENRIGDILQLPYAYCQHDRDKSKKGEPRKPHIHMIIGFPNTTTESHAWNVFNRLNAAGKKAIFGIEAVVNIRHAYDYLIHDTESARKCGKFLYDVSCRITGNNFDIGNFEQISQADKDRMLKEICDFVIDNNLTNFADVYVQIITQFDSSYFSVLKSYSGLIERISRGLFLKVESQKSKTK